MKKGCWKSRKSQVTVFIIIAIVIVVAVAAIFVLKSKKIGLISLPDEVTRVDNLIDSCYEVSLKIYILTSGLQGGYILSEKEYLVTNLSKIYYWYSNNKSVAPSIDEIQQEIIRNVEQSMIICLNQSNFPEFDIKVKEFPKVTVIIQQNEVRSTMRYDIFLSKNEKSYRLNKQKQKIFDIPIGKMHISSLEIINQLVEDTNHLNLGYLANLHFNITVMEYNNESIVYQMWDPNSNIDDVQFIWRFAVKA